MMKNEIVFTGVVKDKSNELPLPGASAFLWQTSGDVFNRSKITIGETKTNDMGEFEFLFEELPKSDYEIEVIADGTFQYGGYTINKYYPERFGLGYSSEQTHEFLLVPKGVIDIKLNTTMSWQPGETLCISTPTGGSCYMDSVIFPPPSSGTWKMEEIHGNDYTRIGWIIQRKGQIRIDTSVNLYCPAFTGIDLTINY